MKALIIIQRLMILGVGILGFLLLISEAPTQEGILSQLFVTGSGFVLILLALGWGWLTGVEESWIKS